MIDHALRFSDETTAQTALPAFYATAWDGSRCIPKQTITTSPAVWDNTDPMHPVLVTPATTLSGFWITIALDSLSQDLVSLPNGALRFAFDRDAQAFVHRAQDLNLALLATAKIEPVFAGVTYPFGG